MTIRHSTCGLLAFYNNTKVDLFFSWLRFKHTMENPEKRRILSVCGRELENDFSEKNKKKESP